MVDEADVVAFLSDPASYPHRPPEVEVVETHMSWVFLAGDRVFKMKKALRFPFLDFTTLESRRLNCEREVALNQRLAPGIYERVVAVTREPSGAFAFDGTGERVEWLVLMRRLDRNRLLDRAILRREVAAADIDRLCELLGTFYAETPRVELDVETWLQWWRDSIDRVEATLTDSFLPLPRRQADSALGLLNGFLAAHADLLGTRAEQRRIVDGHGDLRAEHVHLGPPLRVVDRLEFDSRLRWADPFDEAAFLALECDRLGAAWIGPRLLRGLAERLGERPPAALLRFYRCYRACLRAALSIEHLRDPEPRTPERWPRQAREYLDIATAGVESADRA